jgi:anti-anti-sigma factor
MRAITVSHKQSASSLEGGIPLRRASRHALRLHSSELTPAIVVISAHGDIDASNADELHAGVRHALGRHHGVIIDLSAVKFFGTEGFSVVDEINGALEQPGRIAVVPSSAVTRVLRLCTPASTLVTAFDVDAALAAIQSQLRPVLHLVAEAH